ncbi:hypothetical protein EYF80_035959 [Liparis tanakae]|uniref:Uncharacterized protein n=1 Tax=Liparis tanakae TaxID=230148 RepID=A0A4Z2GLY5_9TELE|nr:hypothetical protein EYF80_035959 [Liparis tanakae]
MEQIPGFSSGKSLVFVFCFIRISLVDIGPLSSEVDESVKVTQLWLEKRQRLLDQFARRDFDPPTGRNVNGARRMNLPALLLSEVAFDCEGRGGLRSAASALLNRSQRGMEPI